MALYLGIDSGGAFISSDGYSLLDTNGMPLATLSLSSKQKIILGNVVYRLNINLPTKESE